ncbi:hypothetical protein Vafri_6911, partial [Volvox africanus]
VSHSSLEVLILYCTFVQPISTIETQTVGLDCERIHNVSTSLTGYWSTATGCKLLGNWWKPQISAHSARRNAWRIAGSHLCYDLAGSSSSTSGGRCSGGTGWESCARLCQRARWTRAALKAGKHVLCEKPFTANAEEAREVQDLARSRGLVCREAFHYREHPLMEHLRALLGSPALGVSSGSPGCQEASGGVLGRLRSVDVAVLIPKWVFGGTNIRFQESLAGGAAMDAGCYCLHAIRSLVGGQPVVESAAAVMAAKSQVVDAAMSGTLQWLEGSNTGLRASFRASLQHDGPLPVSTIDVRGERGHLHCSNFIMPVFGNVVRLTTTAAASETSNAKGSGNAVSTSVNRVYGSGESTYYYQLSRFVRDVCRVKDASKDGDEGALVMASTILLDDAADSIASMHLVDEVYVAAGLTPRLPSAKAATIQPVDPAIQ